jgi:hypothetical protein
VEYFAEAPPSNSVMIAAQYGLYPSPKDRPVSTSARCTADVEGSRGIVAATSIDCRVTGEDAIHAAPLGSIVAREILRLVPELGEGVRPDPF